MPLDDACFWLHRFRMCMRVRYNHHEYISVKLIGIVNAILNKGKYLNGKYLIGKYSIGIIGVLCVDLVDLHRVDYLKIKFDSVKY